MPTDGTAASQAIDSIPVGQPKRSVVLASCDGAKHIGAQLDSILPQLAKHDEIIVSDDASRDNTVEVVRALGDSRIRILANKVRIGYVRNFERAIEAANGEHIFFSDQDDIWLPQKIQLMSHALIHKRCVVTDAIVVNEELRELHPSYFHLRRTESYSLTATFLRPSFIGATMACQTDYLRTLLPFPMAVPHDFWITINAIWDKSLKVIPEPMILYRRHSAAASVTAMNSKRPLRIILIERVRLARSLLSRRLPYIRRRAAATND